MFVFASSTDQTPYEPLIQKIGDAFRTYEVLIIITQIILTMFLKFIDKFSWFTNKKNFIVSFSNYYYEADSKSLLVRKFLIIS